jgi:alpha-mannosidase
MIRALRVVRRWRAIRAPVRLAVRRALLTALLAALPRASPAHAVYLMNNNHTDYNWNATAAEYDAAMLAEMDFYLDQIDATGGAPPEEQARYAADNWWWLWLYEKNRTPEQFDRLLDAIRSGHITVPLNPFVTLYGALPTEAAIRAGYYPGRMMRRHGLQFLTAENIENHTSPWGLASLWAGSGARYTWKGVCGCAQSAPARQGDELFFWEGPDGKTLLFKWYELLGSNQDWGGYAEARENLGSSAALDGAIQMTTARMPGLQATGLFGAGWDDVSWRNRTVLDTVIAYNAAGGPDRAIVSNGIDFFQGLEARGETALLATLRGGWGNDWDAWPASLAERTARQRRALERLRLAEMLSAVAQLHDKTFWAPVRDALEAGLVSTWKYFEHGWSVAPGGPTVAQMAADKGAWTQDVEAAVAQAVAAAGAAVAAQFSTPDEDRVAVVNPLGFPRTDVVDLPLPPGGPFVVTDVATGLEARSQVIQRDGQAFLRFLAAGVPPLGYRLYRYAPGTPAPAPPAAVVDVGAGTIENTRYRMTIGSGARITSLVDLAAGRELAGAAGLNAFAFGTETGRAAENVGPVSVTFRFDLAMPARTVLVTLYDAIDRIDVENVITQSLSTTAAYTFHANLPGAQIRFEEVGAVARPGLVSEGGDFLPGTRASRMTLNHFVDFALPEYHLIVSNQDAYLMQVNDSTNASFDLVGDAVHILAMETALGAAIFDQGGDSLFRDRFALRGVAGGWDGAEAMRTALAHQNPLHPIPLPRNQAGPLTTPAAGFLAVSDENVVVTAFKPAEDPLSGFVVRAWELGGQDTDFQIFLALLGATEAWETSLVETDQAPAALAGGALSASIGAGEIQTWRISVARRLTVTVEADPTTSGVRLQWLDGEPPFVVRRSTLPQPGAGWIDLTPPGGTAAMEWNDAGALTDGQNYFYRIEEPR